MKTNNNYFIFSFFFITISLCFLIISQSEKPKYSFDWSDIRPQVKDTVIALTEYGAIVGGATGYFGRTPQQYHRANWFKENATKKELQKLLSYKNGVIKGYAFDGLIAKKDSLVFNYLMNSYNESALVVKELGCTAKIERLSDYYLSSVEFNRNKFTQEKQKTIDSIYEFIETSKVTEQEENAYWESIN